jgi:hypothetical protein
VEEGLEGIGLRLDGIITSSGEIGMSSYAIELKHNLR